ncbi:MAG: HD domain-containing protein [Gemmataceae bacterium]|nr:HD domain-containing protein [Gemmataceae bacterium]
MVDRQLDAEAQLWQLRQQLTQERRARSEATTVAQRALRDLFETQQELAATEERFRNIVETVRLGIYREAPDGVVALANGTLLSMAGWEPREANAPFRWDKTGLACSPPRSVIYQRLEREGHLTALESSWRRADGAEISVRENVRIVRKRDGTPAYYEGTVEDITAQKQAEARLQRQAQRLDALRTIDLAISSSLDLRVVFTVLLDQVTTQLNADAASVLLFNSRTQTLQFGGVRGFRTSALAHTRLALGEGHAGRAAKQRRPVVIADLGAEPGLFDRAPYLDAEQFVAYAAVPLIAKGELNGVLEVFHRRPWDSDADWLNFLETLGGQAAVAIDSLSAHRELQEAQLELAQTYEKTLEGWVRALDLRDNETEGHTRRVTEMSVRLARALGLPEEDVMHIRRGALLHDIGKIAIPDAILLKPGPLTEAEFSVMRRHTQFAQELLAPIGYLRPAIDIPRCHHERWDGSGYPSGLGGESIPLAARLFAVVDVWDALRSDRPYRRALPDDQVRAHIARSAGTHFDPAVVKVFLETEWIRDIDSGPKVAITSR